MKSAFLFFLLIYVSVASTAQVDCPPAIERSCTEINDPFPVITLVPGVSELVPGSLVGNADCDASDLKVEYFLKDIVNDELSDQPDCFQEIQVRRFSVNDIVWPEQTIDVVGRPLDEVLADPMLYEGISPPLDNICNLIYTYRDQILPGTINKKVIRTWTALDWCSATTVESVQIIKVDLPQINGLFVDLDNCADGVVGVEDFDVVLNGAIVDYQECAQSSVTYTIGDLLNCVATSNNILGSDILELKFKSSDSPLNGISLQDIIDIQKHILGLSTLDTNCKLLAADVNNDGSINGIDLIELRKLILGIYLELPQNESTKYYLDGDIDKPLVFKASDFPLSRDITIGVIRTGNVD